MSTRSFVVACACAALTLPARSLAAPRPTAFFAPVSLALPSRARVESAWLRPHLDRTRVLRAAQAPTQDEVDAVFAGVEMPLFA